MKKAPNESPRKTARSADKHGTSHVFRQLALDSCKRNIFRIVPNRAESCRNVLPGIYLQMKTGKQ